MKPDITKLARDAGWPKDDWEFGGNGRDTWVYPLLPKPAYKSDGGRVHRVRLDPDNTDHMLALAECRWPTTDYAHSIVIDKGLALFAAVPKREVIEYADECEGATLCEAIRAALEAAGPKETSTSS